MRSEESCQAEERVLTEDKQKTGGQRWAEARPKAIDEGLLHPLQMGFKVPCGTTSLHLPAGSRGPLTSDRLQGKPQADTMWSSVGLPEKIQDKQLYLR